PPFRGVIAERLLELVDRRVERLPQDVVSRLSPRPPEPPGARVGEEVRQHLYLEGVGPFATAVIVSEELLAEPGKEHDAGDVLRPDLVQAGGRRVWGQVAVPAAQEGDRARLPVVRGL